MQSNSGERIYCLDDLISRSEAKRVNDSSPAELCDDVSASTDVMYGSKTPYFVNEHYAVWGYAPKKWSESGVCGPHEVNDQLSFVNGSIGKLFSQARKV